jgi:hypothetical protein
MKRRCAALAAAVALLGAASTDSPIGPASAVAKSCSGGWTHAVINRAEKCLRRGQFCARGADGQYHRYGFHCHHRDARGNYHLT